MVIVTIDEFQKAKKMDFDARLKWMNLHRNYVKKWIYEHFSYESAKSLYDQALHDDNLQPLFYSIISNDRMSNTEKLNIITKTLGSRGNIVLLLGNRGTGKTVLAYYMSELLHLNIKERIWYFGLPTKFPYFIEGSTIDFDEIPEGTTAMLEEAGVQFYNRMSMTKGSKNVMQKLPIVRHSGRNFLTITQNLEISDVGFFNNASSIIWTSPVLFQFIQKTRPTIDSKIQMFVPRELGKALFYNDTIGLLEFSYNLPRWWKEEYSTPYARIDKKTGYRLAADLIRRGIDEELISTQLSLRSVRITELELTRMKELLRRTETNILELNDNDLYNFLIAGFDDTPIGEKPANKHYNFEQTPIQKISWDYRLNNDPELFVRVGICINREIEKQIRFSVLKRNLIVSIYGETGSGKSWAAAALALFIEKITKIKFEPDNVCYSSSEQMDRLKIVKRNATLIRNEQLKKWGAGSDKGDQELKNAEETMRRRHINFIFVSPDLREHLHHFILETYAIDERNGISKLIVYSPDRQVLGYITLRKPSREMLEILEPKDETAKDAVVERRSSVNTDIEKAVKELSVDPIYMVLKSQGQRLAYIRQKYPNTTESEKADILYALEVEKIKKETISKQ